MARQPLAALSPELAAAQEQLHRLRQRHRQQRIQEGPSLRRPLRANIIDHPSPACPSTPASEPTLTAPHLGWESEALTRALQVAAARRRAAAIEQKARSLHWLPPAAPSPPPDPFPMTETAEEKAIRLYPDVALAMLRTGVVASGRVWLLLRYLDTKGQGWVTVATARSHLTGKKSPLRICGWRQLRNLLSQGEGLFWRREERPAHNGRIWLHSLANVAADLGISRLSLRSVSLPIDCLLQTIGTVRAHFYASYHSGRRRPRPIARASLSTISGVSRRTQHAYEQKAGVKRRQNWAVGSASTEAARQETAWRQGQALFQFTDHNGKYGPPGKCYLAWQLPNTYHGPHELHAKGHRKRTNRKLVDLFTQGITGNDREKVVTRCEEYNSGRRFYDHGVAAAKGYERSPERDIYWKSHLRVGRYHIWHLLPARESTP